MATNKMEFTGSISLAYAKRIVQYEFAEHLIKIDRNNDSRTYEVHIIDGVDKKSIEKFKSYWKNNFKVKVYSLKYEL